ncbi:L-fuculokinase [Carboxylicivirga sp. M1479]|uniref:L-fuculokinase n=1 Tax=Carboxylicivirga sp. M1479 TaxID=2594476 RepID=UPI001178A44A|nr:L-fuculokinase [Carboxylicivirga sp. M1479]TRX63539.1 L-fuculokinase [Carboxylicivirga sp. M1479]
MIEKDIAIVFDCGATNVRVIAIDDAGQILSSYALPNETDEDPHYAGGRIWDLEKLWGKLRKAAKYVTSEIDCSRIAGATVTTFGVDGAFVDEKGELLYPVISWQCQRTSAIMDNIDKYLPLQDLYKITGVYPYAFNTINKMIWFKENKPEIVDEAHRFVFIPSLLIHKLSGVLLNDVTMMGTTMMSDLKDRKLSKRVMDAIGVDAELFGEIGEAGQQAGSINQQAHEETGLPLDVPVFLAGHDTQFAIFGSGAQLNQPVLSSGTWEILMTRSQSFKSTQKELDNNLTIEIDAQKGVYDIGQNWLGSGVLEWFSRHYYPELKGDELYETMIADAEQELPGANGLMVDPAFYDDGSSANGGTIKGLTINTQRGQLYRAFLESLAFRLREALDALEVAGNFKAERIICVGGGSKNRLWNQLRADVCNVPIQFIDQKETTVLGASMYVFAGLGVSKTSMAARNKIDYKPKLVMPSGNSAIYNSLYKKYLNFKK